jgi:hypothetical protein
LKAVLSDADQVYVPNFDDQTGLLIAPQKIHPPSHTMQSYLFRKFYSKKLSLIMVDQSQDFKNRIKELSDSCVKRFHSILPTRASLCIPDLYYKLACRHLLHQQPSDDMPEQCPLCGHWVEGAENLDHLQSCIKTRNVECTNRHQGLINTTKDLSVFAGADFHAEQQNAQGKRIDGNVVTLFGEYSIDISVFHTACQSYRQGQKTHLQIAEARDQIKNNKYLNQEAFEGRLFTPGVVSSLGAFSLGYLSIITVLAECAFQNGKTSRESFYLRAIDELLVKLHLGNAKISQSAITRHLRGRQGNPHRPPPPNPRLRDPLPHVPPPVPPAPPLPPPPPPAADPPVDPPPPIDPPQPHLQNRHCSVCFEYEPEKTFPLSLVGCTCHRVPVVYQGYHADLGPVAVCIGCLIEHFENTSRCPGPCHAEIAAYLIDNGEGGIIVQDVVRRVRNIGDAVFVDEAALLDIANRDNPDAWVAQLALQELREGGLGHDDE